MNLLKHYIMIFFVSMVPIVELRGAIPISQGFGLPLLQSYIICVIGNMLPVPVIFFFARRYLFGERIKSLLEDSLHGALTKVNVEAEKLKEKAGKGLYVALLLFVGISTSGHRRMDRNIGCKLLDMDFKKSVIACMGGVLLAGVIMGVGSVAGVSFFNALF